MRHLHNPTRSALGFSTPQRNRYFYGKLLDVNHFQMETRYMNQKRWLLNRLVSGYGVICGLDVIPSSDHSSIYVTSGAAIDAWGREILVPHDTEPILLPADLVGEPPPVQPTETPDEPEKPDYEQDRVRQEKRPKRKEQEQTYIHVVICYLECEGDPTPSMAGECDEGSKCAPGSIYERYRIEFRPGKADPFPVWDCNIPDVIERDELDYGRLVEWVTRSCPEVLSDPCLPLANIRIDWKDGEPHCHTDNIDITVRSIVFGGDVLFRLIMSSIIESPRHRRSK